MAIRSKVAFADYRGIVHVQIEFDGRVVFGAYDNFGRDSVVMSDTISTVVLNEFVRRRTLKGYSQKTQSGS